LVAPDWRIEALTAAHGDIAAALYRRFFPEPWERPWTSAEFVALLATPGCFGHVLVDGADDRPCGLILLRVAADEAEILTIGVAPESRRRGGAARLLERAVTECAARGVRALFLDVADDNAPARRFYAGHGFSEIGTRPSYYARGAAPAVAARVMRRQLSQGA
jgi:ribosomal-protein-alanine N-acetyltransferase